jgi:hypothetical protein
MDPIVLHERELHASLRTAFLGWNEAGERHKSFLARVHQPISDLRALAREHRLSGQKVAEAKERIRMAFAAWLEFLSEHERYLREIGFFRWSIPGSK